MKRATLSALPAATPRPAQAADLTDRLLERERQPLQAQPGPGNLEPPKRRREPPASKRAARPAPSALAPASPGTAEAMPAEPVAPAPQPSNSLHTALAAADQAVQALQAAGHSAPARYELAMRYRLDALAHHLQQVREFVGGLTPR
jgi:hypothetical protein